MSCHIKRHDVVTNLRNELQPGSLRRFAGQALSAVMELFDDAILSSSEGLCGLIEGNDGLRLR